ncbi:hypothetical protein HK100_000204 [Physocladia obscura]|uniref:Uncharacterized protein n=1 Tax=Physocladia obscura TaxID=109957 RepID=A0AAD5XCP5_9FUNG|nr:hypothetical protein HK100_000204 [Physocladia obscura]
MPGDVTMSAYVGFFDRSLSVQREGLLHSERDAFFGEIVDRDRVELSPGGDPGAARPQLDKSKSLNSVSVLLINNPAKVFHIGDLDSGGDTSVVDVDESLWHFIPHRRVVVVKVFTAKY